MRRQVVAAMAVATLVLLDGGVVHAAARADKGKPTSESPSQTGFHDATHSAWCNEVVPDEPSCSATATATADASSATLDVVLAAGHPDPLVPARHRVAAAHATVLGYRSSATGGTWEAVVRVDQSSTTSSGGRAAGALVLELEAPCTGTPYCSWYGGRVVSSQQVRGPGWYTLKVSDGTSGLARITLRGAASNNPYGDSVTVHGRYIPVNPLCTGWFPPCGIWFPGFSQPLPTVVGTGRAEASAVATVASLELH